MRFSQGRNSDIPTSSNAVPLKCTSGQNHSHLRSLRFSPASARGLWSAWNHFSPRCHGWNQSLKVGLSSCSPWSWRAFECSRDKYVSRLERSRGSHHSSSVNGHLRPNHPIWCIVSFVHRGLHHRIHDAERSGRDKVKGSNIVCKAGRLKTSTFQWKVQRIIVFQGIEMYTGLETNK